MNALKTPDGEALQVRVGIASGQVVVGDVSGDIAYRSRAIYRIEASYAQKSN